MVRVDPQTHGRLAAIADSSGVSLTVALSRSVAAYERQLFFERLNDGFAKLRANAKLWKQYQDESRAWDRASTDGLRGW